MLYIYILKLQKGKYYIGKTTNPNIRIGKHFGRKGAAWTKRYRPIKVLDVIKTKDHFDEDKWTLKYMDKMGIQNVRGGSFCQMKLQSDMESVISRMLNGSKDRCFKCGNTGHFAKDCIAVSHISTPPKKIIIDEYESDVSVENHNEDLITQTLLEPELKRDESRCPCYCIIL